MPNIDWAIPGALASGVAAGIKKKAEALDVALLAFPDGARWSAVTTEHQLRAAPVRRMERQLAQSPRVPLKLVVINAGNANACTGEAGPKAATATARAAAMAYACDAEQVAVSSTGVIGVPLPDWKIKTALPEAIRALRPDGWGDAAAAIRTTDKAEKHAYHEVATASGRRLGAIGAIAKGAGMIAPNMATMLCYVVTDLGFDDAALDAMLQVAAAHSFNRVSVDGDRSTNDTLLLAATGKSSADGNDPVVRAAFQDALNDICLTLALELVRDGEGARSIAAITVEGALSDADASVVARAIGGSLLVKTALYGADPNWGRIAAAAGSTRVAVLEETLTVEICGIRLFHRGELPDPKDEVRAGEAMRATTIPIRVVIGRGPGKATHWASDLGHEYVDCNAAYRT